MDIRKSAEEISNLVSMQQNLVLLAESPNKLGIEVILFYKEQETSKELKVESVFIDRKNRVFPIYLLYLYGSGAFTFGISPYAYASIIKDNQNIDVEKRLLLDVMMFARYVTIKLEEIFPQILH